MLCIIVLCDVMFHVSLCCVMFCFIVLCDVMYHCVV